MRRERSPCFPSDEPPADHEISAAIRKGRPEKHRPPDPIIASIDMSTVEAAHEAASRVLGDAVDGAALQRIAIALSEAWGARMAFGGLFRMLAAEGGGRPRSPDAVLVFDCREILALHGLKATIGGDTDGAQRSMAVQLADALVRAITGKNWRVSLRQIRGARGISMGFRT